MFSVQAELADKVAASLGGNGGSNFGAIKRRLLLEAKQRAPANLSAYDLWLLAREQTTLRNKESNVKGFEYIDKAIALDPNFAPAYSTRAWLKMQKYWIFGAPSWATQIKEFESDLRQALALDPSSASAHAGLIRYFADTGQWTELPAEIDRAVRDNPTNTLVLSTAAEQLPSLGRPEEGVAMADLALRLDPQMPKSQLRSLPPAYFFDRKFERAIALIDQIPEENRDAGPRFIRAASYAFLGRAEDAERAEADLIAKDGEQVMEIWFNDGDSFARTIEHDLEREGFRKLGLRICATDDELKKFDNPKRLPECVKT
jgi:tetratricopeptide (TPR) repeat protein